jgi:hypothetical protein
VDPKHAYYMAVNKEVVRSFLSDRKPEKGRAKVGV